MYSSLDYNKEKTKSLLENKIEIAIDSQDTTKEL